MKKRLSVLLAVLLLLSAAVPAAANTPVLGGDLDDSGRVTTADARIALRAAIGLERLDERRTHLADADGSGSVDTKDARLILRAAIGLENLFITPWHTEHVWNDGTVTLAPGCETEGEKIFVCTVCGKSRTEPIPSKGGHQWDDGEITVAPGCETEGAKVLTCSVCGDQRGITLPAAGHTWESANQVISPATWFGDGLELYRCAVCGRERQFPIPALGKVREDDRADRLLAFMKAHGETDGSVTVYKFTEMEGSFQLSYDESVPENGFLFTFDFSQKMNYGEYGSNTSYSSLSFTLLPPFSAYEGAYRFKVGKLTYLDCTFSVADPAKFRTQNKILGMEITVIKNNAGLSESGVRDEVGRGLQGILYSLEESLKKNEADFSVYTDLGFAHLDEWKPE